MADTDPLWMLNKLYEQAAKQAANEARQEAAEREIARIAAEMKNGFDGMRTEMSLQYGHVRGEILSLKDEERRRADDLAERLDEGHRRGRRVFQVLLIAAVAVIVLGQQVLEHLPSILQLLGL